MNMTEVTISIPEETWEYCKRAAESEGNQRPPEKYVTDLVMIARGMIGVTNLFFTIFGGKGVKDVQAVPNKKNQTVPKMLPESTGNKPTE